jgi:hypothetical protein
MDAFNGVIVLQPMLAHMVVHEAQVAARVMAGELQDNTPLRRSYFKPMQLA